MKTRLAFTICLSAVTITAASTILASAAEAQRGRGGGGRGGGGGYSRGGGGGGSFGARPSRPSNGPSMRGGSRSSINQNISGNRGQYGGGNRGQYGGGNRVNQPIAGGSRGNINTGNINRGNVNIDRDYNVNIDNDWDGGWGGGYYRPGYGAGVVAGAAIGAAVVGSYYRSLPSNCVSVYRVSVAYYQCGSAWYQPVYSGTTVQYVVVQAP